MIYALIFIFFKINLYCEDSSLSIFYYKPYSDILANADLTLVSSIEKNRAGVNTAFLGDILENSVSASLWKDYYGGGTYAFVSSSFKLLNDLGIGVSYLGYSSGEEDVYLMDQSVRSITYENDRIFSIFSGYKINSNLNMGLKIKEIRSTIIEKYSASTLSGDMDILYKPGLSFLIYGGIENAAGSLKYIDEKESVPRTLKLELEKTFYFNNLNLRTGLGYKKTNDFNVYSLAFSAKPIYIPIIFDAGYMRENDKNFFSFGATLNIENVFFSYAVRYPEIFGSLMQRFSITYFFENYNENKKIGNKVKRNTTDKQKKEHKKEIKPDKNLNNIIIF